MKVLLVDDSRVMRLMIRRTLRQAGFDGMDLQEAENGRDALDKALASPPDLILADWNMPEMTGIELLERVREEGLKMDFGFITSESGERVRQTASDAGASFLIAKPFTVQDFQAKLQPILGR